MEVLQSETHLYEKLPDSLFSQHAAHLSFQIDAQVSVLTELHDDVDVVSICVGVVVLHNVGTVYLRKNRRFMHRFLPLSRCHPTRIDLLQYIHSLIIYTRSLG